MLYNGSGRTINFVVPKSGKEILIETEQVLEADDKLAKILLKNFPDLKVLGEAINPEKEEVKEEKGGDPEIERIKGEERYVCSTCDANFGKGEYRLFREHLKEHA